MARIRNATPTLKSVRRMTNLRCAMSEINPRLMGLDGLPLDAYRNPDHYLWDPNVFCASPDGKLLESLQEELNYTYESDATRAVLLKGRIIEISTVRSAIAARAISRKLSSALDPLFQDCSCAYRPGRSAEDAVLRARDLIRSGLYWALKADIKHFFGSVHRERLAEILADWIPDAGLRNLILNAITSVVVFRDRSCQRTDGLPQGNGLSPLLSNLYLDDFDRACAHLRLLRYADDILVLTKCQADAQRAKEFIATQLAGLGLDLKEEKTAICDLRREPLVYLGYELRGGNIYPPQAAICLLETRLRISGDKERHRHMRNFTRRYRIGPVRKLFRRLDRRLSKWYPTGVTLVGLLEVFWGIPARPERGQCSAP